VKLNFLDEAMPEKMSGAAEAQYALERLIDDEVDADSFVEVKPEHY
jgi:hypothetical protein